MKCCPKCGTVKPLTEFSPDKSKASGRVSHCKTCAAERSRDYYRRTNGEKSREHYRNNRDLRLAQQREWKAANPDRVQEHTRKQTRARVRTPEQVRKSYMKRRHGGIEEWARMWDAQNGHCYLCHREFQPGDSIHVDHDHACCLSSKGDSKSCPACRRGLAHAACNQIIGLIGEDMSLLRVIIANFEATQAVTRLRIESAQRFQQDALDPGIT